jgi:hypothetical protein
VAGVEDKMLAVKLCMFAFMQLHATAPAVAAGLCAAKLAKLSAEPAVRSALCGEFAQGKAARMRRALQNPRNRKALVASVSDLYRELWAFAHPGGGGAALALPPAVLEVGKSTTVDLAWGRPLMNAGVSVHVLSEHSSYVQALAVGGDGGRWLFSGSDDKAVCVWGLRGLERTRRRRRLIREEHTVPAETRSTAAACVCARVHCPVHYYYLI